MVVLLADGMPRASVYIFPQLCQALFNFIQVAKIAEQGDAIKNALFKVNFRFVLADIGKFVDEVFRDIPGSELMMRKTCRFQRL